MRREGAGIIALGWVAIDSVGACGTKTEDFVKFGPTRCRVLSGRGRLEDRALTTEQLSEDSRIFLASIAGNLGGSMRVPGLPEKGCLGLMVRWGSDARFCSRETMVYPCLFIDIYDGNQDLLVKNEN